jgi:hypothetical protein
MISGNRCFRVPAIEAVKQRDDLQTTLLTASGGNRYEIQLNSGRR